MDAADAYVEVQERLIGVVADLDDDAAAAPARACPEWSIRDVIAHQAGNAVDLTTIGAPELEGVNLLEQWRDAEVATARDSATARQVAQRRGRSVAELVDEWRVATKALLPMMRGEVPFAGSAAAMGPLATGVLVNDIVVHEDDIRATLGLGQADETVALSMAIMGYGFSLEYRLQQLGLPPLVLDYGKQRQLGVGDPGATVRADRYTLLRMLAARLTGDEIRALDWEGAPDPYVAILPEYGPVAR